MDIEKEIGKEKYIVCRCTEEGAEYVINRTISGACIYIYADHSKVYSLQIGNQGNWVTVDKCFDTLEEAVESIVKRVKNNFNLKQP